MTDPQTSGLGSGAPASTSEAPISTGGSRAFVTLSRKHPNDVGQRQVIARVDGQPNVTLLFGESVTQEIPPGAHKLHVNNTLVWKKLDFHVEPGEHIEFVVINRPGRFTLGFLSLLGVAPLFLTIERRSIV